MAATKHCAGCLRDLPATPDEFYRLTQSPDGLTSRCKSCFRKYRQQGTAPKATVSASGTVLASGLEPIQPKPKPLPNVGYVASKELLQIWEAVQGTAENGTHPVNLMFLGPSGCGKTVGAEYLAGLTGLAYTKVDAAAMTDPEAWFGTREVVSQEGVSVTTYRPSVFVEAIARPGVLLIDEINRVRDEHRNILLPLLDGTHRVTNPLTGETIYKDPGCFIIMSGNRGLQFTGTYAVDPALMTRSVVIEFDYLGTADEIRVARSQTGCDEDAAKVFVRFANETRTRAKQDPDMAPMSTREVINACRLVAKGLSSDLAAQIAVINGASDEGGAASIRHRLTAIWAGIRPGAQSK